ncbi:MAG: nuclear transport factor 2 family protein [Planctomycetota bacterium]|nr:nuclear transport factor 2 family protein [Planctomycetota bacterium]
MKKSMMLAAASLVLCAGMQDPMASEKKAVERAVLDYVEGVYEVKPELIERSVHPQLAKIGYARRSAEGPWREIPMTFEQLVELAGSYNADGRIAEDASKKVEVLDVMDKTASAKLTAAWGIDYMHLAKYDGKWQIIHVLWQTPPAAAGH